MFDLPKYLPDILRESGSLFGVFALVAIVIALVVVFLFRDSEKQQKERVFLYTSLFMLALVFSALTAGVSTGFQSGKEVAITQTKGNESLVKLPPATLQAIESYLTKQGQAVTSQSRAQVLSDALSAYLGGDSSSAPSAVLPANNSADTGSEAANGSSMTGSAPDGFTFTGESCEQRDKTMTCSGLITNTKDDINVYLFASNGKSLSRIVDSEGNQYVAKEITTGSETSPYYQLVTFTQNVPVKVTLVFAEVTSKPTNIALMEVQGSTTSNYSDADVSFQARNISLDN